MPPKQLQQNKPTKQQTSAPALAPGGGRSQGSGRGQGKGNGKGNGKGYNAENPSSESSGVCTSDRRDIVVVANEDRAAKVRKIKHCIQSHRKGDDIIARALLAPTRGATGDRVQLRYLQVAEDVVTNAIFPHDDASESSEVQGMSSQASSLLSSSVSSGKRADDSEALLSILTVQSVMLMVNKFDMHTYIYNVPDRYFLCRILIRKSIRFIKK